MGRHGDLVVATLGAPIFRRTRISGGNWSRGDQFPPEILIVDAALALELRIRRRMAGQVDAMVSSGGGSLLDRVRSALRSSLYRGEYEEIDEHLERLASVNPPHIAALAETVCSTSTASSSSCGSASNSSKRERRHHDAGGAVDLDPWHDR